MHTPEAITEKLQDIVETIEGVRPAPEQNLRFDVGMDSLERVELIMEVEKFYGIDVSNEEFDSIKTLQNAVDLVGKLLQEKEKEKQL
jgi:acyl carrier protein